MLPFNTFSIFNFAGFAVTAPIAVVFMVIYWQLGRRLVDMLFAILMACIAGVCLAIFFSDNFIPAGVSSLAVPGAGEATLFWIRIVNTVGLVSMPIQLHFVFRYCRIRLARRPAPVLLLYAFFLVWIPGLWTDAFLQVRTEPLAETASWAYAAPWMPQAGPAFLVFPAVWLGLHVLIQWVLYRDQQRGQDEERKASAGLRSIRVVRFGFLCQAVGGLADFLLAGAGYAGISMLPFSSILLAVLIASALVREHLQAERQRQQLLREMQLAERIQTDLLPEIPPETAGFDLCGWSRPAQHTGGDTYDFLPLPDGRLLVTLADASGHGMGPALVVTETRALLRAVASHGGGASEILANVDGLLSLDLRDGRFATCFVGLLDPRDATLAYASAGQAPIFLYHRRGNRIEQERATAPPLGISVVKRDPGENRAFQFTSGDFLAVVSDGLYEATDPAGETFGLDRLRRCLRRYHDRSAKEIIARTYMDVREFIGPSEQADDMTMVILRKR